MSTVDAVCKSDTEYIWLAGHTDNPVLLQTVFRIQDILVWIQIQTCGSMPLSNGLFSSLTFKMRTKNYFFYKVFLFITMPLTNGPGSGSGS